MLVLQAAILNQLENIRTCWLNLSLQRLASSPREGKLPAELHPAFDAVPRPLLFAAGTAAL